MFKKILLSVIAFVFTFLPGFASARENVVDWYIKDFNSEIIVNKDSSLDITETIVADTGMGIDKHGIFRILPTKLNVEDKKISTPVELISIANQAGQTYEYQTIKDRKNGTVTWKIGSADKTVQGVNVYVIKYRVQNAIRFSNEDFDELYWNLNGNFWDLQTDKYHASIVFPQEINEQNSKVSYYTGAIGSKDKNLAKFAWSTSNVLEFDSTKTLLQRQGITASVTFPKNIITPYQPNFSEKYGEFLFLLIPVFVFLILYLVWKKYGDDPEFSKTVIAEYEIPQGLSPIEVGMLMKSGGFENSLITAEIIFLATKGVITIKEIEKKILLFTNKDYELIRNDNLREEQLLNDAQKKILEGIFTDENKTIKLSTLKNRFQKNIPFIKSAVSKQLKANGLVSDRAFSIATLYRIIGPFFLFFAFGRIDASILLAISLGLVGALLLFFSFIMPRRTLLGTEMNWKVNGFKLFMKTVDKDRAVFYEKENIFEKCLPYAIVFGMTKEWIKRVQEIYGVEYLASHAPVWYVGSSMSSFDASSFSTAMENLSSDIAANTSSASGSRGGGMSGGGGGGGGGGGW